MRRVGIATALLVGLVAGCFSPRPAPGLECTSDGRCPAGQDCVNGICEGTPDPDAPAGSADASPSRNDAPPGTPDAPPGPDAAPATGDLCGNAIPVTYPGSYPGSFTGAGDNYDPPGGACANTDGVEVVFRLELAVGTPIFVEVETDDASGKWYVHTTCPPVATQSCGGFSPSGGGSTTVTYPAGTHYIVVERSPLSAGTTFMLQLGPPPP